MTAIVGVHLNGRTWLASDGLVRDDNGGKVTEHEPKIFRAGAWLVAVAGNLASANALKENAWSLGPSTTIAEFFQGIRGILGRANLLKVADDGGVGNRYDVGLLVGHPTGLWSCGADLGYVQHADGCPQAKGSGGDYALGALAYALAAGAAKPAIACRKAIEIAIAYDTACGGTIQVEATPE